MNQMNQYLNENTSDVQYYLNILYNYLVKTYGTDLPDKFKYYNDSNLDNVNNYQRLINNKAITIAAESEKEANFLNLALEFLFNNNTCTLKDMIEGFIEQREEIEYLEKHPPNINKLVKRFKSLDEGLQIQLMYLIKKLLKYSKIAYTNKLYTDLNALPLRQLIEVMDNLDGMDGGNDDDGSRNGEKEEEEEERIPLPTELHSMYSGSNSPNKILIPDFLEYEGSMTNAQSKMPSPNREKLELVYYNHDTSKSSTYGISTRKTVVFNRKNIARLLEESLDADSKVRIRFLLEYPDFSLSEEMEDDE